MSGRRPVGIKIGKDHTEVWKDNGGLSRRDKNVKKGRHKAMGGKNENKNSPISMALTATSGLLFS